MERMLSKSIFLFLCIAHCTMPAADPGPASSASSSSSPAPAKVAALAEAARPPEAMVAARRGSGDDGKREAQSHGAGAAAAAAGAALPVTPYVFVPPVLKPMSDRQRKKLNDKLLKAVKKVVGTEAEVATLLEQGADPNALGKDGQCPLASAAAFGNVVNIKALLAARADVQAKSMKIVAPIACAVRLDRVAAIRELIKNKADVNCTDHLTIFDIPCHSFTQLCLVPLSRNEEDRQSLFRAACTQDNVDVVRALLDKGLSVNARMAHVKSGKGAMLLHIAALEGANSCVELLIEKNADINVRIENDDEVFGGQTPYSCALLEGFSKSADLLLRAGANGALELIASDHAREKIKGASKERRDNFFARYFEERPRKFKVMQANGTLDQGIFKAINLHKLLGDRSLISQLVICARNDEIEKMTAENRVSQHDLMRRDDANMNAILWAAIFGNVPAMRIFRERGNSLPLALADAPPTGWKAKIKAKIGKKPIPEKPIPFNPFCKDEFGNSAVQLAKRRNDASMANFLYECNAPVRRGIISLIARNRIAKQGRDTMPAALSMHIAEFVHGGRFLVRPALVAGLLESPRAVGGAAAAAAAAVRSESPKAESKEAKELVKKD